MELNNNEFANASNPAEQDNKPHAYRVEDDDNLEESDLRRSYLFGKGDEEKSANEPNMEAEGEGGEHFGETVNTPAGDDPNNPSQNTGYNNEYFRRTEPLEEHPEQNNFRDANQLGQSNYSESTGAAPTGQSDTENTGPEVEGSEENKDEQQTSYQEGTADNDGQRDSDEDNVAGYNELPEQQKVGGAGGNTSVPGEANYHPEDDAGTPDYGSNSPESRS